jgi:cation transport ATPase
VVIAEPYGLEIANAWTYMRIWTPMASVPGVQPSAKAGWLTQLSYSTETYIAAVAVVGIVLHLILLFFSSQPDSISRLPLIAVLVIGGLPLMLQLGRRPLAFEFGSDLLAGIAILASVAVGEYLVGSIIVLMLSGGAALENYATRRASSVLEALARRGFRCEVLGGGDFRPGRIG